MAGRWRCHIGGMGLEVPPPWQADGGATSVVVGWRCHMGGREMEVPHGWQ